MILHGRTNGKIIVASLSHHHYVSKDGLMMDGGQCLTNHYAGYSRYSMEGEPVWFEVPDTFEELYNAWNTRKLDGIWNVEDVRIIPKEEYDNIDIFQEKVNNFLWGTNGKNGDEPFRRVLLKNCSKDHLKAILENVAHIQEETKEVIEYLLYGKLPK
jgi:hypothetical protein